VKQAGDRKLAVAESKTEYKTRLGRSPDFGDPFCQIGELLVRKGLLKSIENVAGASGWGAYRALALKAQKRFTNEFAHGQT
jgi:hypothetical protein